jgi:hypothetical protein
MSSRDGGVAQVVEHACLANMRLSSNPSTEKKKKRKKERKK